MSSLLQQLQKIKTDQRSLKVGPQQQQPTLIFDAHTATTTSHDLIYTLSIISYSKLLLSQPNLKIEGDIVMSSENREINRNTLSKQVNRDLSQKLIKFMLKISPYLLSLDCQKVLEYLLHNYKVNIFEAQALAIIYLQYWNHPIYQKLIGNISQKTLSLKLPFLIKISQKKSINLTYIVKNLSYNHYLISSLLMYTLEYLKYDNTNHQTMDIQINLNDEQHNLEESENLVRCDPRRFLLTIFSEFINRKMNSCYKYIIQFCGKAVQIKHHSTQTISFVMLMATRLLIQGSISDELLSTLHLKLIKGMYSSNEGTIKSLFDFTLIIWQRKPSCITKQTLYYLENMGSFLIYLTKFKCSLWMILMRLIELVIEGVQCQKVVNCIANRIKKDQFYQLYDEQYLESFFNLIQKAFQDENKHIAFLSEFLKVNYLHEMAFYYNKKTISSNQYQQFILDHFEKGTYKISKNNTIIFNLNMIPKKVALSTKKQQKKIEKMIQPQSQIQQEKINTDKHSVIERLRNLGHQIEQINYEDEQIKNDLARLVDKYYLENQQRQKNVHQAVESSLTIHQKNQILSHYFGLYNSKRIEIDIKNKDLIFATKYLSAIADVQASKVCLLALQQHIEFTDDVLYRQMMRLSLLHLSSNLKVNYKQTIYFVNTLFKKIINKYINEGKETAELIKISDILLKVSEQIFKKQGIKKGKYHRILHNHGRLIAQLIIGLKSKKQISKDLESQQRAILSHYIRIIKIFTTENIYLLNIGIVQVLTRRQLDHNNLRYFITKLLLGSIRQSGFNYYHLTYSLAKTIVFCSQLGNTLKLKNDDIEPSLTSGIAKHVITDFFGLIKEKFKRVMTKKLLLFIKSIFQNTYVVESFKAHLVQMSEQQLSQLLILFTEFYKILGLIQSNQKQVDLFKQSIMDKITNIFPLNLRLVLFEPLLPDQHLYKYLAEQLEEHSPQKSQFQQLKHLINIVPLDVSFEWVKFVRECLKRGYKPDENLVSMVLQNNLGSINNYAQLICELALFYPESLHPHLEKCAKILESHCQEPNDFTLALISRLIKSLGQIFDPYLSGLILTSLSFDSDFTESFIAQITDHLVTSTLIRLVKENHKQSNHFRNFSLFFKKVVMKGVGDSLNKTCLNFISRTLNAHLQNEENPQSIIRLQSQIFLEISIKMNENQLRKGIIDLVRWSQVKSQIQDKLPFNLRKAITSQIFCLLQENLQSLFNHFYGYIFQSTLKDYQNISKAFQMERKPIKVGSGSKRPRQQSTEYQQELTELYLKVSLKSFELLFNNDNDHQFLDSVKIEVMGDPLSELLILSQSERYTKVITQFLIPCLVSFHRCISDDYQMKTINLKVLVLLKNKNPKVQRSIFQLTDKLVDVLKDRFLLLVGDLVPFLLELAGSRHEGIAKIVRTIIGKIQELSGQQIQNYAK